METFECFLEAQIVHHPLCKSSREREREIEGVLKLRITIFCQIIRKKCYLYVIFLNLELNSKLEIQKLQKEGCYCLKYIFDA